MTMTRDHRRATLEDIGSITAMLDAATTTHIGRRTSPAETEQRLRTPGCDLSTDSLLVLDGHDVVGLALVWAAPPADVKGFARVHPDWRDRGVGTELASFMTTRAGALAAALPAERVTFSTTSWSRDTGAATVLEGAGLEVVRHFIRMSRDLHGALPEPRWPDGLAVRAFAPGNDEDALFAAYADAFADHWGHESDPTSWWWDERDSPDSAYDPSLWFVATDGDEIAGFVNGRVRERQQGREGYVSFVGVRPRWRGRRLGHALLAHELRAFSGRGLTVGALDVDVDNVTSALALYRSVGLEPQPNFVAWGTEFPGGGAPSVR